MKPCNHSNWLSLQRRDNDIDFVQTDRADTILHSLPNSDTQRPSLCILIGNRSKVRALRELVSTRIEKRSTGKRGHGEIHLHIEPGTSFSDRPLLFADGDFPSSDKPTTKARVVKCHASTTTSLPRTREGVLSQGLQRAADDVYVRLLLPFTDVFCFFTADLGGLQPTAHRIATWLNNYQLSILPAATQPQIIVVIESPTIECHVSRLLADLVKLIEEETQVDPAILFSRINILSLLPDGKLSSEARYRKLREALLKASDYVRIKRIEFRMLFSALHLAAFLRYAGGHFVGASMEPMNFVSLARIGNPVALDLKQHLINILCKIGSLAEVRSLAVPLLSSYLFLDSYPPDMHLFAPSDVFDILYKEACHQACRDGLLLDDPSCLILPSGFTRMIKDGFVELFEKLTSRSINTAVDLHRQVLLRLHIERYFKSDETCIHCGFRIPMRGFECGHCICENCVRAFGRRSIHDPWDFEFDSCPLCGHPSSGLAFSLLPPTAGIRLLTFDGGGVRGLRTLVYLQLLQERIGLDYPVQDHFDVVYGTSIGGIIAMGLSIKGWSVAQCIEYIERFAKLAFKPRSSLISQIPQILQLPLISQILEFLILCLADARYPAENMEEALREAFGSSITMLDCSHATKSGTRVGIPVTTIRDTSVCVFTNYNGIGTRSPGCGYHVFGPHDGSGRVPLWEIARCTSAAPFYFTPRHILGLGTFQDGGLRQNDPRSLAEEEIAAMYYSSTTEPSLVVSLGTGSSRSDEIPRMSPTRGIFRDGFIARLIRAFMQSFTSREGHKFRSRRKDGRKEQYFRFDVECDGPEPALDDITRMQEIKTTTRNAMQGSKELDRLARCVVAQLFIFQLDPDHEPRRENGKYECFGRISCRIRANDPTFKALVEQLSRLSAKFYLQGHIVEGDMKDESWFDGRGDMSKRIFIDVPDRKATITIQLREGSHEPCGISGSPYTIDSLVDAEQLDRYFGTSYHEKRKRVSINSAYSNKRQRLDTMGV